MDTRTMMLLFGIVIGAMAITGAFVLLVNIIFSWIKKG